MNKDQIIDWLLAGDVSIQYQTYRDLLNIENPELRARIESEGWGRLFLCKRNTNGYWGKGFYQPKWTSTHYTLLDLKNLHIPPENNQIRKTLSNILQELKGRDGGIYPIGTLQKSGVCVNGMVLNYASYFHANEELLKLVVDFLLTEKMKDGGFNCQSNKKGAVHSSLHSTLSVLEGIFEYQYNGYTYRIAELRQARSSSQEFILLHRLFRSDRTGAIINSNFLRLHYPPRWYYDILRAMDYFQLAKVPYDGRMNEALDIIYNKKNKDGLWNLPGNYPGQIHFEMERAGKPSRWNTLRALRVLKYYKKL